MLAAFDTSALAGRRSSTKSTRVNVSQIEQWKQRVSRYITESPESKTVKPSVLLEATARYFTRLKTVLARRTSEALPLGLLSNEFRKLQRLIIDLEQFESASEQAYAPVKTYLDTVNKFFEDSSKQLVFRDATNQVAFQVRDKRNEPVGALRDVDLLSSGERQLLTLFTNIKFSVGGVFVIDEPELSLHPKWQQEFLGGIKTLMPQNAQLIVATHSPSIVGKNVQYCITLLPYNE
jgi:predicted ATP-dependent endonuclease of OLD family